PSGPYHDIKELLNIKRTLSIPFSPRGRTRFLVLLGYRVDGKVNIEIRNLLELIGDQLALGLERIELLDALERRERELKSLTTGLVDSIEEERRQIALSLHDESGQSLMALKVELDIIEKWLPVDEERCMKSLGVIREQIQHITESTRRISYSLHPSILEDLGLVSTLRWYIDSFVKGKELEVDIEASGFDEELPMQMNLTLYRVAQETLTNVVRHADASRVLLKLTKGYPRVILVIDDNGKGFSLDEGAVPERGLGIVGMRERVGDLGGNFQIRTSPGNGTHIRVTLPLEVDDGNQY
ncbi:MAG: sensor histidine kinase, partial [Candidatus Krumholzibacteria bacterium]|nr:sensor histidine kinase [Candidatus Krumholzibacteria bacterium]